MKSSKNMVRLAVCLAITAQIVSAVAFGAEKRALRPEDMYLVQSVADPQVSPDGTTVAYTVTRIDQAKNKRVSSIWLVPVDGSAPAHKLTGTQSAKSARWSPDGHLLAYLASAVEQPETPEIKSEAKPTKADAASGKSQIYTIAPTGGDATRLTNFKSGVSHFNWSPDGTHLACVVRTGIDDDLPMLSDTKDYTSMVYKADGVGWANGKYNHIWIVDSKTGKGKALTNAAYHDDTDPQWSPDGKWIAFNSENASPELRDTLETSDVFVVSSEGGAPRVLADKHTRVLDPRWSPDGKWIAYAAAPSSDKQALLWLVGAGGGASKLATDTDLFPTSVVWSEAGQLYFVADERGAQHVFRVDPKTGKTARILEGQRFVHELDISEKQHRLVYAANDSQHPTELFSSDMDGSNEKQLTNHNRELLEQVALEPVTEFTWTSVDGWKIQGFFIKPLDWKPGKKYPMVLNIHGGPNGMWGNQWGFDNQLYAAQGWTVLLTNPRGSSGYGMNFQRGVANEWGGKAYQDIMNGVQTALAQNSWIDKDRLGVVGFSYGGFMTDWMVTQTTIFKAAIPMCGISDLVSIEGTRDGAFGHSRDFGGDMFENFDPYWKYSAVRLASKVRTPMLFLHGEADNRVPPSQAEEYFRALKHFGLPTEIVLFPRESHSFFISSEPKHLLQTYQWRIYWFDRYLNGNTQATAPDERRPGSTVHEEVVGH